MGLNPIRVSLVVVVSYMLIVYVSCDDKKNLLSDPSYVEQLQTLQAKTQTLEAKVRTLSRKRTYRKRQQSEPNNAGGGSTFVRWGRTDCPSNLTELVYSGYAGGSLYAHHGAAADYLCLPRDPEWLHRTITLEGCMGQSTNLPMVTLHSGHRHTT